MSSITSRLAPYLGHCLATVGISLYIKSQTDYGHPFQKPAVVLAMAANSVALAIICDSVMAGVALAVFSAVVYPDETSIPSDHALIAQVSAFGLSSLVFAIKQLTSSLRYILHP